MVRKRDWDDGRRGEVYRCVRDRTSEWRSSVVHDGS